MGWNYVAVRYVDKYEDTVEVRYELHEEFPDIQEGSVRCITLTPVHVSGDSPADLAAWLRRAADDVEKISPVEDHSVDTEEGKVNIDGVPV